MSDPNRFTAIYEIRPCADESAEARARDITLEQTVELPAAVVPEEIAATMVGRVETLEPIDTGVWQTRISYPLAAVGDELTQLLNVLFGNISLKHGIRLVDVEWPEALLATFGGPGCGISGIRALTGVHDRALVATAIKPMGLSARDLAAHCHAFALGGVDIVKDDHGLANQPSAPFDERLLRCQAAVTDVNAAEGGSVQYFPNVTAPWPTMMARAEAARSAGCRGVLVNAWVTGVDALSALREEFGLALMAHPALTGTYFRPDHGITADVLLGDIFRMAGADAVIYPNHGGRFGFSRALCERINDRLRRPLAGLRTALPVPGGGISVDSAGDWARRYGRDTVLLIGGSLYAQQDLAAGARRLNEATRQAR